MIEDAVQEMRCRIFWRTVLHQLVEDAVEFNRKPEDSKEFEDAYITLLHDDKEVGLLCELAGFDTLAFYDAYVKPLRGVIQ